MKQAIDGIIVLNKPKAISSNSALQQVKRIVKAKKAGHGGSLDPIATGVLPICLGEATKFANFALNADKEYQVTAKLGFSTDSGDITGQVINRSREVNVSSLELSQVINNFKGELQQIPPMYSALKYKGKPLYKYARAGITIDREPRNVVVNSIELIKYDGDEFKLHVSCSKGTYIRSLINDIGNVLGCGACMTELERVSAGALSIDKSCSFEELEKNNYKYIIDMEELLIDLPEVYISDKNSTAIKRGQSINYQLGGFSGLVRLRNFDENNFFGVGELSQDGILTAKRLLSMA